MQVLSTDQNIFDLPDAPHTAVCVTTNGIVKRNGQAVMGKGIAKEADMRFHVSDLLGKKLSVCGNHVYDLGLVQNGRQTYRLVSFPTKNDWRDNSTIKRITQSAYELIAYCIEHEIETCYLPPAGCGCGGLDWDNVVSPILSQIFDDRFITVIRA